jgi:hypothetical protein
MATFQKWKELGRYVRKGEKALTLCQPITIKVPIDGGGDVRDDADVIVRFTYRPKWFVQAQTDGAELPPMPTPTWDTARALVALAVMEIPLRSNNPLIVGPRISH